MAGAINYKEGAFRLSADGKMFKRGDCVYANGDKYDGEWLQGKRWGKGKYSYANGDVFFGEFENNQWHGFGVHARTDFVDATTMEGKRVFPFINAINICAGSYGRL